MFGAVARKIFGTANERRIRAYRPRVDAINGMGTLDALPRGAHTVGRSLAPNAPHFQALLTIRITITTMNTYDEARRHAPQGHDVSHR